MSQNQEVRRISRPRAGSSPPGLSLAEAKAQWISVCESNGLREKTIGWYEERLDVFLRYADKKGISHLKQLTPDVAEDFMRHLRTGHIRGTGRQNGQGRGGQLSEATVRGTYNVLNIFFRWACQRRLLKVNPLAGIRRPRVKKDHIPAATIADIRRLLKTARSQAGFRGKRDATIIVLTFDTGLRLSEVAGLTLGDIDWQSDNLTVLGKGGKERRVYFGIDTRRELKRYLKSRQAAIREDSTDDGPAAPLFITQEGRPLTASGVSTTYKRLRKKAGVAARFHGLRHAFGAEWTRQGGDPFYLQDQLGHSTLDMVRLYARTFPADRRSKARRYSPYSGLVSRR